MRLSAVASDALLGVARSIQLCLIDVLERHRLTEAAYHQHVAEIEEELSEASQRADALQALVVASDAAAVRLERRVDQLDRMLRDQLTLTDHLSGECRDLQLAQLARAPQSPIPVPCTTQPVTPPPRAGASPSPHFPLPASPSDSWHGSALPALPTSRFSVGAPALGHSDSAVLAAHVAQLNALQSSSPAPVPVANHSRRHDVELAAFAPQCHSEFYVAPGDVPVGASRLPRSRVTMKTAEKITLDKACVKLFSSAADPGFLTKGLKYYEGFEARLRPWGLAELFRLLLTRRVRVIVDPGNYAGDFSRIIQMLQAAAQPYAGLNRLSPYWLLATRDLGSRGIVYVEADTLTELDSMLAHVLLTYADDAASQRVLSKCPPSESAYITWLKLCNYPFSAPGFSETGMRNASRDYLNTLKWDCKKIAFSQWEQEVCSAIRCHHLLFPSGEFDFPSTYLDHLWTLVGTERTGRYRPHVDMQYDDSYYQNSQLVIGEAELPTYIGRMARALKDSDAAAHAGSGVSVGNVQVDIAAVMSQLQKLKKSVSASAAKQTGAGAAAACKYCQQTPCRGVCPNCLECSHTLAQCMYPGGPKHDPAQHAGKFGSAPKEFCCRCRDKGHRAHSCLKYKLSDVKGRVFHGLANEAAVALAKERAKPAKDAAQPAKGAAARSSGAHSVGVRDNATGDIKRAYRSNPPRGPSKAFTKRLDKVIAEFEAGAPSAPPPSTDRQSQHAVDMAYVASLAEQFARHSRTVGAVFVFGTNLPMGTVPRSPPYLGSTIIEVGMSTAATNSSLVNRAMHAGDFYMIDGGSPLNIIPTRHALRGCTMLRRNSLQLSGVRVRGFLPDSAVTEPLLCGELSLKLYESLTGGIREEKVFVFFSDQIEFDLYSELYWTRALGYSLLECSDPEHLPAWTRSYAAKFASGNRFLVKRTSSGYVALEHTPAGDQKYTGMYSISPQNPNHDLFRQLCVTYETCDSISKLPCKTVSLDRQRAFYAAASTDACPDSVSVSSVLFPAMDPPAGSHATALQQLAAQTAEAHRAGADELSLAALVLDQSGLSSVSDLRVPDGLQPAVVCSRCERPGCRADICQQPCRLCDRAQGHEPSCLRFDFHDGTITRFSSTADDVEISSSIGIQAVYPSMGPPADAPKVSGAAVAPALSPEDLALLQRVRPDLLDHLCHIKSMPCTANGTPLRLVFDELPLGERFELCRLFDRGRDNRHGSTIRDSAQSSFRKLCKVVTANFNAST